MSWFFFNFGELWELSKEKDTNCKIAKIDNIDKIATKPYTHVLLKSCQDIYEVVKS
jgi:hypothetical protein